MYTYRLKEGLEVIIKSSRVRWYWNEIRFGVCVVDSTDVCSWLLHFATLNSENSFVSIVLWWQPPLLGRIIIDLVYRHH
jgi:hypothetical protein